jgi:transcriptional regulator with XRE-family HTH domain
MLKKFAEELKEARIKSGISLQQIHFKTRIDIKFLEAIENGDFDVLPEVYLRAIIREYINFIGLDEKVEMYKYDLAKSGKPIDEEQSRKLKEEKKESEHGRKKMVFTAAEDISPSVPEETSVKQSKLNPKFIFIFSILILIIVFVYLFLIKGSSSEIITERSPDIAIPESKQRYETNEILANKVNSNKRYFDSKDSLTLIIKTADTSWIGYKVDNKSNEQDFILYPNSQKRIRAARDFELTIGNSNSVELILNEKPLNFKGGYKEVKLVKVDSTGLFYLPSIKTETGKNE